MASNVEPSAPDWYVENTDYFVLDDCKNNVLHKQKADDDQVVATVAQRWSGLIPARRQSPETDRRVLLVLDRRTEATMESAPTRPSDKASEDFTMEMIRIGSMPAVRDSGQTLRLENDFPNRT